MIRKLCGLFQKHWDIVIYLVFGVLTTFVNYAVYFPLYNAVGLSALLSNAVAWFAAVITAFLTNKPFVFKSNDWSFRVVVSELAKFLGSRLASGAAETVILFLTVDVLLIDGNIMKLVTGVLVVIFNYFASKFFVFTKR